MSRVRFAPAIFSATITCLHHELHQVLRVKAEWFGMHSDWLRSSVHSLEQHGFADPSNITEYYLPVSISAPRRSGMLSGVLQMQEL
jgi:hypothetical protein